MIRTEAPSTPCGGASAMSGGTMEEIWHEMREEPLVAVWLAGNALGFLCLIWLLLET